MLTTGVMISLFGAPIVQNNPLMDYMNSMTTITAMAAEAYSDNWSIDSNGTWHYYMNDGSLCTSAWVHDNGQWYLLDASGNMLTGVVKSNGGKYYLLDTVRGTGTYGKMLTNGSVYNGVTISASVNADDEGSLSADTIAQLRAANVNVDNVPNVENTKHVENGEVVFANTPTPQQNPSTQSGGTGEGGSTTSSTDDINQTGKITDPNDLEPGQFAIIDGHMWARDPSSGTLYDMGSASGEYYSGYVPGIS